MQPGGTLVLGTLNFDTLVLADGSGPGEKLELLATVSNATPGVSGLRGVAGVVFSPDGRDLYTAAYLDSAVAHFRVLAPPGCIESDTTRCLQGHRFETTVTWKDFAGNTGSGRVVPAGSDDSGLFYFFHPDNWELLVKVLDACSFNDRFWVFSAATTNVEYTLTVTDRETGVTRSYFNPLGRRAPATTDTSAFATCSGAAASQAGATAGRREELERALAAWPETREAPWVTDSWQPAVGPGPALAAMAPTLPTLQRRQMAPWNGGEPAAEGTSPSPALGARRVLVADDTTHLAPRAACVPGPTTACLNDGRFAVEVEWKEFTGKSGDGSVVPCGSDDSALFYFFDPANWEMLIKVLDACSFNNRFWVFSAATTNVEYTLKVTDTETGAVRTYFNPLGNRADAITDTSAFATCP